MKSLPGLIVFMLGAMLSTLSAQEEPKIGDSMTDDQVSAFAQLALKGIPQEFPNKPSNVIVARDRVLSPKELHPAFHGSFDWHSSVHGHWMLIRLLRLYPESSVADEIEALLDTQLTPEKIKGEVDYFQRKENRSFERMYGWAWALRLAAELHAWEDTRADRWATAFKPLEDEIVTLTEEYLPKLTWPIRTGVHPDSAFAFGQVLDYAREVGNNALEKMIAKRSRDFYLDDQNYPAAYEPSGEDFFSAGLNEADLMRRVLTNEEYAEWLRGFFPGLKEGKLGNLLTPVSVSDVTDGKLVHLAGLNLSRAWTLNGIASALGDTPEAEILQRAAEEHAKAGFSYVFSGHYEGEHWLATFAIYALTEVGITKE